MQRGCCAKNIFRARSQRASYPSLRVLPRLLLYSLSLSAFAFSASGLHSGQYLSDPLTIASHLPCLPLHALLSDGIAYPFAFFFMSILRLDAALRAFALARAWVLGLRLRSAKSLNTLDLPTFLVNCLTAASTSLSFTLTAGKS
jgi:hypothetical protein